MRGAIDYFFAKKGKVNPKNALCFDRGVEAAQGTRRKLSQHIGIGGQIPAGTEVRGGRREENRIMGNVRVVDAIIIVVYFAVMAVMGIIAYRRNKTSEDFFVAGKSMGTFSLAAMWLSS